MDIMLEMQNLTKHYPDFSLDEISLQVPAGSVVGFVGSNGAGKTTTIKALLGIIFPENGCIKLFDKDIAAIAKEEYAQLKQRVGVVLDTCAFPHEYNVSSVEKCMRATYRNWDTALFWTYIDTFKLPRKKSVKELSRGMSMKLSLACALSHDAELLILDEATAGLDPLARDEVLDVLRTYMYDGTRSILMSSHITSDLEKIADYIVCIEEGRIIFSVEKDTITDTAGIARCRTDEVASIRDSGLFEPGQVRCIQNAYSVSVLVPNRFDLAKKLPSITLERATIDEYLSHMLKGEVV